MRCGVLSLSLQQMSTAIRQPWRCAAGGNEDPTMAEFRVRQEDPFLRRKRKVNLVLLHMDGAMALVPPWKWYLWRTKEKLLRVDIVLVWYLRYRLPQLIPALDN